VGLHLLVDQVDQLDRRNRVGQVDLWVLWVLHHQRCHRDLLGLRDLVDQRHRHLLLGLGLRAEEDCLLLVHLRLQVDHRGRGFQVGQVGLWVQVRRVEHLVRGRLLRLLVRNLLHLQVDQLGLVGQRGMVCMLVVSGFRRVLSVAFLACLAFRVLRVVLVCLVFRPSLMDQVVLAGSIRRKNQMALGCSEPVWFLVWVQRERALGSHNQEWALAAAVCCIGPDVWYDCFLEYSSEN